MADHTTRYVLVLGDDAERAASANGATVIRRVGDVIVLETDEQSAATLTLGTDHAHVYRSREAALRALSVFER